MVRRIEGHHFPRGGHLGRSEPRKVAPEDLVSLLSTNGWRLLVVQSIVIDLLSSVDDSLHVVTSYASISQARTALGCANLMRTYRYGRRRRRPLIYICGGFTESRHAPADSLICTPPQPSLLDEARGVELNGRAGTPREPALTRGPPEYPLTWWGGPLGGVSCATPLPPSCGSPCSARADH